MQKNIRGFTLIELLIVIAIIAILAGVVFVSLNPLQRFQDARNSARWTDITAVLSALKVDQVDNGGQYASSLTPSASFTIGENYMIGTDTGGSCSNAGCTSFATTTGRCINLTSLATEGYLARVPVSPTGANPWSPTETGYYLMRNGNGSLTVGACDAEGSPAPAISVNR